MADLSWSEAHWQKVNDCVTEAFSKASVATSFLPCYGPLSGGAETVRNERLVIETDQSKPDDPPVVRLDGDHDAVNLKLVNLTVKVELTSEQVADDTLANATLVFRRAANILAQESDLIVFEGYYRGGPDSVYVANQIQPQKGLADLPARFEFEPVTKPINGGDIVKAVVTAIQQLEDRFHPGSFACVLGRDFFDEVHTPTSALVLPADRISPLLKGGPLLRSGKMDATTGIVVSLAGNAIDMVVGTPPAVQFLQRTPEARYLFRVYTRFVLRIRDEISIPVAGFTYADRDTQAARLKEFADLAALVPVVKARLRRP